MLPAKRLIHSVILVIFGFIAIGLWRRNFDVSLGDVKDIFDSISWDLAPVIFLLLAFHVSLSALRWLEFEESFGGERADFSLAFISGAIAMGLGTFLPAPLMGVACRSIANKMVGTSSLRGALSGTLDQFSDFAIYAWIAIPALLALFSNEVSVFLVFGPAMLILGIPVLCLLSYILSPAKPHWPLSKMKWIALLFSPKTLIRVYILSSLRLINITAITILVGQSIDAQISPLNLGIAVPLVSIANAIVMFPGAIGVAEWSFTTVLGHLGTPEPSQISFVIANRALLTVLPLLLSILVLSYALMRVHGTKARLS